MGDGGDHMNSGDNSVSFPDVLLPGPDGSMVVDGGAGGDSAMVSVVIFLYSNMAHLSGRFLTGRCFLTICRDHWLLTIYDLTTGTS